MIYLAIKKSELYSSLWKSCDALRGGMDASQYKDYILVLLFTRYVSDKYGGLDDSRIEIPPGGSFKDLIALKGKPEIGDGINKVIAKLAEANDLKGVIDVADFNDPDKLGSGKEMQDRLSDLIAIFQNEILILARINQKETIFWETLMNTSCAILQQSQEKARVSFTHLPKYQE